MSKDLSQEITEVVDGLLSRLGVEAKVEVGKKDSEGYSIQLETDNPGLLIGRHGETLEALQLIVRQILFQKFGKDGDDFVRAVLNVGDWREQREEKISSLAQSYAERVRETGEAQHLFGLTPTERHYVHVLLSESSDVYTESEGEGQDRHLVIYPKN